jgi:hypothetical protein
LIFTHGKSSTTPIPTDRFLSRSAEEAAWRSREDQSFAHRRQTAPIMVSGSRRARD